jgi:hypothetical protein
MPTLHLQVVAGLANRIRSMVSGMLLANDLNIKLKVYWFPYHPAAVCHFDSIFHKSNLPSWMSISAMDLGIGPDTLSENDTYEMLRSWDRKSDLYIKSYGVFYRPNMFRWLAHLRSLQPALRIRQELEERTHTLDFKKTVGVHVRRGDNTKAIEASPLDVFLEEMSQYPADTKFLVATDDLVVKASFQSQFPDRCIFPAKRLVRTSEEGMREAAIDFFALAKTSKILGSAHSSFSEIAALYGSSELKVLTQSQSNAYSH